MYKWPDTLCPCWPNPLWAVPSVNMGVGPTVYKWAGLSVYEHLFEHPAGITRTRKEKGSLGSNKKWAKIYIIKSEKHYVDPIYHLVQQKADWGSGPGPGAQSSRTGPKLDVSLLRDLQGVADFPLRAVVLSGAKTDTYTVTSMPGTQASRRWGRDFRCERRRRGYLPGGECHMSYMYTHRWAPYSLKR